MKDTVVHFNNFIIQGKFTNIYFIFSILCKFFHQASIVWGIQQLSSVCKAKLHNTQEYRFWNQRTLYLCKN